MGKRKERRLAAKIGAGRRVKLDLFAESSGDLCGTVAKDDGKDVDSKHDLELPNSPSSSGQPPENPLSLLGQYSDDEVDKGSNESATNSDDDKQVQISACEPFEEGEIVDAEDHSSQMAHNLDVGRESASASASPISEADAVKSNMVSSDEKDHEVNAENKDHVPVASDTKTNEGMSSTWKMVLHEESNRYYYWNTVTGETSWDIPESSAQEAVLPNGLETLETEMKVNAAPTAPIAFGVNLDDFSASRGVGYTSGISEVAIYKPGDLVNQSLERSGVDGSQFLGSFSVVGAHPYEASSLGNYSLSAHLNTRGGNLTDVSYERHDQSALITEQGAVDLPSNLVKNGEALLERLKLLKRSGYDSVEHVWLSKYMMEIEIRLSDIRCLLPYGLSLVPFWMHSERQLNQLEHAINIEIGSQNNKVSALHVSTEAKGANLVVGCEAKVNANMGKLSPENFVASVHNVDASAMGQKAFHDGALGDGISNVQRTSIHEPYVHLHSGNGGDNEIDEAAVYGKSISNSKFQSNEDVDMVIDMEVEDQGIVDIADQVIAPSGQLFQTSAPVAGFSLTPESEYFIPPPPQEEWIPPPPPPPDEGIPPPPDEPPESLCPPSPPFEREPMPSICSEQQNITYMEPSVNYYGNTITESMGTRFYEHGDASQIAAPPPPAYYAAISNAQSAPLLNPVGSAVYYGIPNEELPVVRLPTTTGPSSFQAASDHSNYDPPSSQQVGTVDAVARASLSKQFIDPPAPGAETVVAPTQLSSTFVASAPTIVCMKEYASAPSYSATATCVVPTSTSVAVPDASAAVPKVQSKDSLMKKLKVSVTSSLRSNKKVSGLVDKWRAAKEELQQEKEHETPFEILEKKRQREIEGWHAQQIASGQAKENANFQPLGGDWRERVKRRRAQKEAAAWTTSHGMDDGSKQLDLSELSRDLPPGWQAYWDDSSRQVYFSNSITSETTWTRPTR